MTDFKLDNNYDLAIENDDLVLVDGVDAIAQDCEVRLLTFLGEWFLDQRIGIPYYQQILGQKPRLVLIKGIIRKGILTTPGILGVKDLQADYINSTRVLSLSFTADTVEGTFVYDKELII